MLPIKKMCIDSRHRTEDSRSSSDFKIELPHTYRLPSDTVFYMCE